MRAALLALLVAASLSACSWAFVPPAPDPQLPPPREQPDCTTSKVAPGLDVAWAIFYAIPALLLAGGALETAFGDGVEAPCIRPAVDGARCPPTPVGFFLVAGALTGSFTALHGFSAAYGYQHTGRCREALVPFVDAARGKAGHVCRADVFLACEPGLVCVNRTCVAPDAPPEEVD